MAMIKLKANCSQINLREISISSENYIIKVIFLLL